MDYKDFALKLARRAGEIIKTDFQLGMKKNLKPDGSPVTKTDLTINNLVIDEIALNFPDHGLIGEEQSRQIEGAEFVWVCDPVDGTVPFSTGMPTCAFSLALTQNGAPVLGVAYDPFMDRMAVAEKGKGAFCNDKILRVSAKQSLDSAYIAYSPWKSMRFTTLGLFEALVFERGINTYPIGSIVYDAILLAAGEIDGIIFPHDTAHDVAAIKVIVEEAGGKVTDLAGRDQRYNEPIKGCILSNSLVHNELVEITKNYLK